MNFEYERSFSVESVDKYIDYCIKNGYRKIKEVWQNRIVYENQTNRNLIARITKEKVNNIQTCVFDCKNVVKKNGNLNESLESLPLEINEKDIPSAQSMLEIMGFEQSANNTRERYVFAKNEVILEIDRYITPKMNVIAIEGEKEQVENVYKEIVNL